MPLGFMFHYCIFVERRLLLAAYLRGSATPKAQPSAATKARRKTKKADYPQSMRLRSVVRLLFVVIRLLSWLFAFTLTESFLCACNSVCGSGILLLQCALHNMNGPPNWSRWLKH